MHTRRGFTSHQISKVLNGEEVYGKYFQKLKTIVTVDRHEGYANIHNTMRLVHPIIMEDIA